MSFNPDEIARWQAHEREAMERLRQATGPSDERFIQPGGGGGGGQVSVRMVYVRPAGGQAGDAQTPCSFVYNVWELGRNPAVDTPSFTGQAPYNRSGQVGRMVYLSTATGQTGLALATDVWHDTSSRFNLLQVFNEHFTVSECDA